MIKSFFLTALIIFSLYPLFSNSNDEITPDNLENYINDETITYEIKSFISLEVLEDFKEFVNTVGHGNNIAIKLFSPGGSLAHSIQIANFVDVLEKNNNVVGYVNEGCNSACTIIFSAFDNRFTSNNATFAFHAAIGTNLLPTVGEERELANELMMKHYSLINEAFADHIYETYLLDQNDKTGIYATESLNNRFGHFSYIDNDMILYHFFAVRFMLYVAEQEPNTK